MRTPWPASPGGSGKLTTGARSAMTVRSQAASSRPWRRIGEPAAGGQVLVGLVALFVQRLEGARLAIEGESRLAGAAGEADGQVGVGGDRNRAALGLEEDRREARIGGGRDPRLQLGGGRGDRRGKSGSIAAGEPRGGLGAGDHQRDEHAQSDGGAERARVAGGEAGMRKADA